MGTFIENTKKKGQNSIWRRETKIRTRQTITGNQKNYTFLKNKQNTFFFLVRNCSRTRRKIWCSWNPRRFIITNSRSGSFLFSLILQRIDLFFSCKIRWKLEKYKITMVNEWKSSDGYIEFDDKVRE